MGFALGETVGSGAGLVTVAVAGGAAVTVGGGGGGTCFADEEFL